MVSLKLADDEARLTAKVADALVGNGTQDVDSAEWISQARSAWEELPIRMRRVAREFRRNSGSSGVLLVEGLPVEAWTLPPTPSVFNSVQRNVSRTAALLAMMAAGLGDPAAFRAEKYGALVQDVVPVKGQEQFQGNAGSVVLELHNENAFHAYRPDYVMLLCLRPDHDGAAGLRTASIRNVLPLLGEELKKRLSTQEFVTAAPPSFGESGEPPRHAVLSGAPEDPDLRVDFAATRGVTDGAQDALMEFRDVMLRAANVLYLDSGNLAVVDNRIATHGRTEFQPRYDGGDRWLQRTFILNDLRRSREFRHRDGHVIVP
ncbi:TauD/TfdA family dioxygenase [Streptomyces sp. NBC_00882]|uniref:TauD/TfdA family dioxygenase n=1 Tax=Streptomyces sp. NBC_00882 TaxID=2975856 RepID=UPI00386AC10F|nr:TauD/TfdA family dioxygenase [Streptomyces sp. NBC_00882]